MYTSNNNTGCLRGGPAGTLGGELENETQVFVWELDDLCSITTPDRHTVESYINCVIGQIFQLEFQIDTLEELDHANVCRRTFLSKSFI
jgi:hypothetical protein